MPRTTVSTELRDHVRELDQFRCAYRHIQEVLAVTTFEIDHIVPKSAGGETIADNLCLACPSCNRHKGARTHVLVPGTEQWVPLYHPRRQVWTAHFSWNEDRTLLIGLTAIGSATVHALHINRQQMVRLRGIWRESGLLDLS